MATNNNAFTLQGSTPKKSNDFLSGYGTGNSFLGTQKSISPLTNALNKAAVAPAPMSRQNMSVAPKPSTPVKKVTTQNVDGSSSTTEYHAPDKQPVASQPVGGLINKNPDPIVSASQSFPTGPKVDDVPNAQPTQKSSVPSSPTFPGLLGLFTSRATQDSPEVRVAREQLKQSQMNQANAEATNRLNPIPIGDQTGREAVIRSQYLAQQNALSKQLESAVTTQGQQLGALESAVGAVKPQAGAAFFGDPLSGGVVGGSTGGSVANPVASIPSLAQAVISGQMSPSQAENSLGNPALTNTLRQQILALNPSFNFVDAEAQAQARNASILQTGTTGGQLSKAADNARAAMGTLQRAYDALSGLQKTQVPGFNQALTALSGLTGVGVAETQAYNTALQEARAAVSSVLSAAGNTPTFSDATASSILPDGAGPGQIAAAIRTIEELIGQKVSSFTGQPNTQSSGGIWNW